MEPFSCAQVRTDKTSIQTLSWGYFTWMWSILKPLCRLRNKGFAPVSRRSWVRIPLEPLSQKRCPEPSLFLAKIFLSSTTLHFLRFSTLSVFPFFSLRELLQISYFHSLFVTMALSLSTVGSTITGPTAIRKAKSCGLDPQNQALQPFLPHSWNPMDGI